MGEGSRLYTSIDAISIAIAGIAAAVAAIIDRRTMRIPNLLTIPLALLGLIFMAWRCLLGLPLYIAGLTCIAPYAIAYGLWRLGMWGGGDAKLIIALLLLASPAYPALLYVSAFLTSLAIILSMKYAALRLSGRRVSPSAMGPSIFIAYVLSAIALTVVLP